MASDESSELGRRMARCEAMLAVMMITGDGPLDPEARFLIREFTQEAFFGPEKPLQGEFYHLLERLLRSREKHPDSYREVGRRLRRLEEEYEKSRDDVYRLRESFVTVHHHDSKSGAGFPWR